MKKTNILLLTMTIFFISIHSYAQTILSAGDIAFVGINTDHDTLGSGFSFILLEDVSTGTSLNITDNGWMDGTSSFRNENGDTALVWTANSDLIAGTVIYVQTKLANTGTLIPPVVSNGSISSEIFITAAIGDQIFIYQGSAASPTFITGIHWNVEPTSNTSNWDDGTTVILNNTTSDLPDQLTNGVNAIWVYASGPSEKDNFKYNCSTTAGDINTLRTEINNIANWDVDYTNTTPHTINPFPCCFLNSWIEPEIPTVSASPTTICSGNSSTLTISGSLNDATEWHIYTGCCGCTEIGTTASSSYTVSPTSTTTYYIRGEGGCATIGSCGPVTVNITPQDDASFNYDAVAYCVDASDPTPTITGLAGGTFSSTLGLIISASTGTIDVSTSTPGTYTVSYTTAGPCPNSSSVSVTINPTYSLNETAAVCSGDSYTFPDGNTQNNITSQVMYTSNLTTIQGCDSIIITTINVNSIYHLTETVVVCSGESYTFPDESTLDNITTQYIYTSNLTTTQGCDSIITTTVNINPVYNLSETNAVCPGESYTFPDGTTLDDITAQFIYTSNLTTTQGCDSIIETTININPVYNLTEIVYVCLGESYIFPDGTTQENITTPLIYTSNLQTVGTLCDSIIVTTINVNPVYNLTETVVVCSGESYTFPDESTLDNITTQYIYTSNLTTTQGCDSIIETTININPVYNLSENNIICSGDSYTFPDGTTQNNITSQVMYNSNFTTIQGCDSIITTTINVNPVYNLTETVVVCPGENYTFPDGTTQNNITTQVIYTSNFTTTQGCDSIIETTVDVNPVYNLTETVEVCSGGSYTFPDGTTQDDITTQVIYTSNLQTIGTLCDSIIETTIDVITVNISVTQDLATLTADAADLEYQWLDCNNAFNPIDGETSQMFEAVSNGSYAVEITDGDCVETSLCYDITSILIEDSKFESSITAFPNPTNGLVNIDLGNSYRKIDITITDSQGRIIKDFSFSNTQSFDLEFEGLPGVYFVLITADSSNANLRLVKK